MWNVPCPWSLSNASAWNEDKEQGGHEDGQQELQYFANCTRYAVNGDNDNGVGHLDYLREKLRMHTVFTKLLGSQMSPQMSHHGIQFDGRLIFLTPPSTARLNNPTISYSEDVVRT